DPAAISARPAVTMMLVELTAPDSPAARANGTVKPSDMPMTISRMVSPAVKCCSTCGVWGIRLLTFSSTCKLPFERPLVLRQAASRGSPCDSSQVSDDAFCPGFDSLPVAEVTFGSPNRLHHHPFSERQSVVVEGSEEDALIPGSEGLLELS